MPDLDDRGQLSGRLNKLVDEHVLPGEQIRVIVRGASDTAMVCTDARLISMNRDVSWGWVANTKVVAFDLKDLTGVLFEDGIVTGAFSVQGVGIIPTRDPGDPHRLVLYRGQYEQARRATIKIRELIAEAKAAIAPEASSPAADPVESIRRLGELLDAGLITPEQFDHKRAELLSRL